MTNHEQYQQAMNKITPSEEWKADTLAKMALARAEKEQQAAPRLRLSLKKWVPLAAAAAFALVMVPAVMRGGTGDAALELGGQEAGEAVQSSAAVYAVPEEPENARKGALGAVAPAEAEAQDEDGLAAPQEGPAEAFDRMAEYPMPTLTYGPQGAELGGTVKFVARSPKELADANPTRGMPQAELPAELPVWYAPCGEANSTMLYDQLDQAAAHLGLHLYTDPQEPLPQGTPNPDCWPSQIQGVLTAAPDYDPAKSRNEQWDKINWEVSAEASGLTLVSGRSNTIGSDESQYSSEEPNRQADRLALEQFGALAGISNPVHFIKPSYNSDGTLGYEWFNHYFYEGGAPADDITRRLLNYSFVRISGGLLADGTLECARVSAMPKTPLAGWYPLRTMEEAAATTLARRLEADRQNQLIPEDLTIRDIVDWRVEYESSGANPWIQPVYCFTLRTSLTPAEASYELPDSEGYQVYVQYRVSALPEEYCVPDEEAFS